jgi:hypothetical protein
MKVLDVTGREGNVGVAGVTSIASGRYKPSEKNAGYIYLRVARLTTLVLLRYTSAGATREDT